MAGLILDFVYINKEETKENKLEQDSKVQQIELLINKLPNNLRLMKEFKIEMKNRNSRQKRLITQIFATC